MTAHYSLKRIPQGELHDSCVAGTCNLPKRVGIESDVGVHRDEAVRQIERLGSKLQLPGFAHLKDPSERHIQLPVTRAFDAKRPQVSERTESRLGKRGWIQVMRSRVAVAIRVSKYLVRPLAVAGAGGTGCSAGLAVQSTVLSCDDTHEIAGGRSQESSQLPASCQLSQHRTLK